MKTQSKSLATAWQVSLLVMLTAIVIMLPDLAHAAGGGAVAGATPIGNALCNAVGFFTGKTGKALATIAILVIGIGALMGKVSWGMAIIVGVGVALIFGAAAMVTAIDGTNTSNC